MKMFDNFSFSKLKQGLSKTKGKIVDGIMETFSGKAQVDDQTLEEIEDVLISGDVGYDTAHKIIEEARKKLVQRNTSDKDTFITVLKEVMENILGMSYEQDELLNSVKSVKPFVLLIIGVNGSGKTTTIGKLANIFGNMNLNVLVGAADTFRAAANEQLDIWANRAGVKIIQSKSGDDPSAIAFSTLQTANELGSDVVIIDTAGRLHTKKNLMEELNKINRVLSKVMSDAPHEIYLVLDGNTGQNALIQAVEFSKYAKITGLVITKLDGTAKGGILFRIADELKIPIKYIGVGEGMEDLQYFDSKKYVEALFS